MSPWSLIFLLGACQGVILAAVLIFRKGRKTADLLLGAWMAAFAVDLLVIFLAEDGRHRILPHLLYLTSAFTFLYGPFFYLYTRFLTGSKTAWTKKDLLHLLPFVIVAGSFVPFFILPAEAKIRMFEASIGAEPSVMGAVQILVRGVHGAVYVVLGFRDIGRSARRASDSISDPGAADLRWLWTLAVSQAVIWLTVLGSLAFRFPAPGVGRFLSKLIWPLGALCVYLIGFMALRRSSLFARSVAAGLDGVAGAASLAAIPATKVHPASAEKYRKTKLEPALAADYEASILRALKGKRLFLNPDLNLGRLAETVGIPAYQVSQVINDRMGRTFFSLINTLRVEEAKRLLLDPASRERSVLDIAFACGFNSKTSFNEVFRRFAKETPTKFRKKSPTS